MDENLSKTIAQSGLSRERYLLADWQARRLAHSYADLAGSERYGLATTFFLSDIYGPTDFSRRDADSERVVGKMRSLLPKRAMGAIEDAMHLNRLTQMLDNQLLEMLFSEMKVQTIDAVHYAEAYRRCDNYVQRCEQIRLVHELGSELDIVVQKPMVQLALRLARGPAHLAGLGELQDFLERGVAAFLHMQGAEYFLNTVRDREMALLDRIYAGGANPFADFPC
ncbi:FFLEELY motif protein [Chitinimonas sp. PSY-7]|uniref:FFLEELY motif protein n=1 Tax=Chitinimonas sp. PSY-7 TaxID=3459088 RepID=UPI00403FF203